MPSSLLEAGKDLIDFAYQLFSGGHCMTLDLSAIRNQFPSLDRPAIFFDNPGGTQIAKQSLERVNKYLLENNANHEGAFATSIASDAVLYEAHRAMADFYNASSPEEIVFGNNMTSLTLDRSRSISRDWRARDEIVVARMGRSMYKNLIAISSYPRCTRCLHKAAKRR